jgi:hypothetical protein
MNSLINVTHHGGQIRIVNSTISEINICGSLIKNTYSHTANVDLDKISDNYFSAAQRIFQERSQALMHSIARFEEYYFFTSHDDETVFKDNHIKFENVTIRNLNYMSKTIDKLTVVSDDNGMRHQGLALSLKGFPGEIQIETT